MRLATVLLLVLLTNMPRHQKTQNIQAQANSSAEDGQMNAEPQRRTRTKWTMDMNTALIDARKQAEDLHQSTQCPKKDDGKKIGIMDLTKKIWDQKGYASLRKTSQNLRDQYANLMKKSKTNTQNITKELNEQRASEPEHLQQQQRQSNLREQQPIEERTIDTNTIPDKYISLVEHARVIFQETKAQKLDNRQQNTFTKKCPDKDEINILNEISRTLITTNPTTEPTEYLWEVNCAIYSTAVAWKIFNGEKQKPTTNTARKERKPKWQVEMERKIEKLRRECSQITEEIRRLTRNAKLTSKLNNNRKWMKKEIKSKITKDVLLQLKETKIQQLRVLKHQRQKKIEGLKRQNANKWFDRNESKFYDHCKNVIKADVTNIRPTYKEPTTLPQETDATNISKNDYADFWRPIWENEKEINIDALWINNVKEAMMESLPPSSRDQITINENDVYTSTKNKRNWSAPGYDKITNYWIKKLPTHFEGLATALTEIINKEVALPQWLTEGKCLMIPKTAKPAPKDHRPITLLNTMYKAITSVIDAQLREHQEKYKYMQIDQRGCSTGSMGCIDNLAIDKAVLEDAEIRRKNLSCIWVDVKKAFDSINHQWLDLCLKIHCIPQKIAKFITTTMKQWTITLEVQTSDTKETIGPIRLNQGILQGDSFCVRLFTICLNPLAWFLRGTEGYTLSHVTKEKITHLLYVDDLKTYHKSPDKAMLMARTLKTMFEDIGLQWGLDKCAAVNIQRGKICPTTNINLNESEELKMLEETDQYKFLGKHENSAHLEQQVYSNTSEEYIKRLSVIWTSNISIPRKIRATNTFALSLLQYQMWTANWLINELKELDRLTREVIRKTGAINNNESLKLLYLPEDQGGSGLKSVEDTYKHTKIKMANYINNSQDQRIKAVKTHEKDKIHKGRKSLFKDATRYAAEYNLNCEFNDTETVIRNKEGKTTNITLPSPRLIKDLLRDATQDKYQHEMKQQTWLGALTTKQLEDQDMSPNANQLFRTWKNIPDVVYSVNKKIRQQLLPTRTYQQTKLQAQVPTTKCRMCDSQTESTSHILSGCSKIAQNLYTARHDRMLRPIYHYLLYKYDFQENDNNKPWYQQSIPISVMENDKSKIMWNTPFKLERAPENGANKPDIAVMNKEDNTWLIIEGTICQVGKIAEKTTLKQIKYNDLRKELKNLYKDCREINQINIVFDFLGGYHVKLEKELSKIIENKKQTDYLIKKMQKWIVAQNNEIVKKFYSYTQ